MNNQTFFKTEKVERCTNPGDQGVIEIVYQAAHNNGKTTFETNISLKFDETFGDVAPITYSLKFGKLPESTNGDTEAALDKLADWMARTAEAIKNRKAPEKQITVY